MSAHRRDVNDYPGERAWHVDDACDRIGGISRSCFYDHVRTGRLVARKLGTRTVVLQSDLERFLSELPMVTPDDEPDR